MAGFLPGTDEHYNPYLLNFLGDYQKNIDQNFGYRSPGEKFSNWWMNAMMGKNGKDPSQILNNDPMKGQYAVQKAENERSTRMNMAFEGGAQPALVNNIVRTGAQRDDQMANAGREAWLHGMTQGMAGLSEQAGSHRVDRRQQGYGDLMGGYGAAEKERQTQGWGGIAMQGLFGAAAQIPRG